MFKTNSLIFPQNKNSKNSNSKKKINQKQQYEKNHKTFRNKNITINTINQIKKPLLQKYHEGNNLNKNHYKKCLTTSNSILYKEIFNKNNSSKKNLENNINEINKEEIIISYEKGVLFLFDNLKNILDKNKYNEMKNKFINEFNSILNKKNNNQSSFHSSNSIKKIIDECINIKISKNNFKQKKIKIYKNYSLLRKSHKSLYTLSRTNNITLSQSPNKFNENNFVNNYSSEKKNNEKKQITKNNVKINSDLINKIKSSLDDDLKDMFNFSYKNFLNNESEK